MELATGYPAKSQDETKKLQNELSSANLLVIKFPDTKALRVISRSLFLVVFILFLPCFGSIFRIPSTSFLYADDIRIDFGSGLIHFELLDLLFQDLSKEGLIKRGDKALIVGSRNLEPVIANSWFLKDNGIDLTLESDLERVASIKSDEMFDFAVVSSSLDTKFVDIAVKTGGIVVVQLNKGIPETYEKQLDYRIEYLGRYNSIILAVRKTSLPNDQLIDSSTKRKIHQLELEGKKAALNDLEDVLLEPPRNDIAKSNKLLKKIKFLPDLLGNSMESYSRRVFIDVGLEEEKGNMMQWFHENYPMGNEFEMYNLEVVAEEDSRRVVAPLQIDVSDWLKKNVREEEYVVMKVEAEVVEEMIKKKAICLVDEMFLECNNQWQDKGLKKRNHKSKRAYWECLALYGMLRDEGVAVHQWWG